MLVCSSRSGEAFMPCGITQAEATFRILLQTNI